MKKAKRAAQSRAHLDERFNRLGPVKRYASRCADGLKLIRESLGMTTAQLAKTLGHAATSVVRY